MLESVVTLFENKKFESFGKEALKFSEDFHWNKIVKNYLITKNPRRVHTCKNALFLFLLGDFFVIYISFFWQLDLCIIYISNAP